MMTVADVAIIAGLVFVWGTVSARLERFDMTAPIVLTVAGVLLTHGPLAPLPMYPNDGSSADPRRPRGAPDREIADDNRSGPARAAPVDALACRRGCPRAGRSQATTVPGSVTRQSPSACTITAL
jgi:hypothetical protein